MIPAPLPLGWKAVVTGLNHEQRVPHPLIFKGAGFVFEFPVGGRMCISSIKAA